MTKHVYTNKANMASCYLNESKIASVQKLNVVYFFTAHWVPLAPKNSGIKIPKVLHI